MDLNLLHFLRDEGGLTGVKNGCDCGHKTISYNGNNPLEPIERELIMSTIPRQVGKHLSLDWEGVVNSEYDASEINGVEGKVIIGSQDGNPNYFVCYFRVGSRGNSSLDQHGHDHRVYIIHGQTEVLLGSETIELNPQDLIYDPGDVVQQFRSIGSEPLGFLCIVPPH